MSDTNTDAGTKSAREIERDVDRTRANISASVEALQERFSVETIIDDVVRSFSKNGGEVSRNLGRTVRDNPLPLILTGVGLAWLIAGSNRSAEEPRGGLGNTYPGSTRLGLPRTMPSSTSPNPAEPMAGRTPEQLARLSDVRGKAMPGASATGGTESQSSASPSMVERASDALEDVRDQAGDLGREAMDQMNRARRSAGNMGSDLGERAEMFITDQPLMVAALGFAAGLGIGGLMPRTRVEDNLLGAQSDAVKSSLKDMAGEQMDKAQAVAGAVAHEAMTMADEVAGKLDESTPDGGDMVDQAKSKVMSAAERLKDAGAREAEKHDQGGGVE